MNKLLALIPSGDFRRAMQPSARIFHRFANHFHLLLLLAVAGSPTLFAQQFATLSLTVADPSGSVIPHASVSARSVDTGAVRTGVSDKLGLTVIPGLPAGEYRPTASAEGFAAYEAPLTLTLGQTATLSITLRVRAATEQLEVSETTTGVDKEQTESSQAIAPEQIADLPISDRDFIDFVLLTSTATVGSNSSSGAQSAFQESELEISFGGLRETHSVFYGLDGVNYTTTVSGVQRVSPSFDWVQEFRVVDGPDVAGGGLNLGAAVNTITKSGTNDLHGSVCEYFRNSAIDASNLLAAPGFKTLRFNQYGATIGGPIRKDTIAHLFALHSELYRHCRLPWARHSQHQSGEDGSWTFHRETGVDPPDWRL